jgi:PilZ domain
VSEEQVQPIVLSDNAPSYSGGGVKLNVNIQVGPAEATKVMGKPNDIRRPPYQQERKHRRFSIRYPVQVKFPLGNAVSGLQAVSNNVSIGGVLLETDSSIPQHCDVSFIITVRQHHIVGPIQLVGEGEVVRVEPHLSGAGFSIAVKCKRPISQLEDYLPASAS